MIHCGISLKVLCEYMGITENYRGGCYIEVTENFLGWGYIEVTEH